MKKLILFSFLCILLVSVTAEQVLANACWSTFAADSAARTFPYFPPNVNVVRDKEFSGGITIINAIENGKFTSTISNWSDVSDGTAKTPYTWWSSAFGGSLFINQSKNLTSGQDPSRFQALEVFQDHRIIALPGDQYNQWAYIFINQSPVNTGGGSRHGFDRRDQSGTISGCEATQVTVIGQFNLSNISAVINNGTKTILPWLDSCCQEANTHSNATYFVNVSSIMRRYMAVINSTNSTMNGTIAYNNTLWINLTWDKGVIEPTHAFITINELATGIKRNITVYNLSTPPIDTTYGTWQAQRGGTLGPMSVAISGLNRGQYTYTIYANGTSGGKKINEYYTTYPFTFQSETIQSIGFNLTASMPNQGIMNYSTATNVPSIPFYLNLTQLNRSNIRNITLTYNNSYGTWNYTITRGEIIIGPDCLDWGLHASNLIVVNANCSDYSAGSNIWPYAINFSKNNSYINITAVNVSTSAIHMIHESWSAIVKFFGGCATGGTCSIFKNNEGGTTNRASFFNISGDQRTGQINYLASVKGVNASINTSTGTYVLLQGMRGSIGQTLTIMLNNTIGPGGNTTMPQNINGTSASYGGSQGTGSTGQNGTTHLFILRNETQTLAESAIEDRLIHGYAWANVTNLTNTTYSLSAVITYLDGTNDTTTPYWINLGLSGQTDTTPPTPTNPTTSNSVPRITDQVNLSAIWTDTSGMSTYVFWSNITGNTTPTSFSGTTTSYYILTVNVTRANNITWIIYANDTYNNWNQTPTQSFIVQNTAPTSSTLSGITNATLYLAQSINLTSSSTDVDLDVITHYLYLNGTLNTSINGSTVTFNLTLPDGSYTLKTLASDNASNATLNSTEITIQIDTTGPNITLYSPVNGTILYDLPVNFGSTITDLSNILNCTLTINGIPQISIQTPSSPLTIPANLPTFGSYTWNISCTDTNGFTTTSQTNIFSYSNTGGPSAGGGGTLPTTPPPTPPTTETPSTLILAVNPSILSTDTTLYRVRFGPDEVVADYTIQNPEAPVTTCSIDSPHQCNILSDHAIRITYRLNTPELYRDQKIHVVINNIPYDIRLNDLNLGTRVLTYPLWMAAVAVIGTAAFITIIFL